MRNIKNTIQAQDINSIKISLSSPEDILAKSSRPKKHYENV